MTDETTTTGLRSKITINANSAAAKSNEECGSPGRQTPTRPYIYEINEDADENGDDDQHDKAWAHVKAKPSIGENGAFVPKQKPYKLIH
jgi:hypothetical protein